MPTKKIVKGSLHSMNQTELLSLATKSEMLIARTSYARTVDGGNTWGTTGNPSPGTSNQDNGGFATTQLPAPVVDKDGQLFQDAVNYNDYQKDALFHVESCGMACCLIRMSCVDHVLQNFGLPFSPAQGWGEDLSFCIRARELGHQPYCDSRVKIGHIGKMVVTEEVFLRGQEENA